MRLQVKRLDPKAKLPECTRRGNDLGYDIFALETTIIWEDLECPVAVRTGIAVRGFSVDSSYATQDYGFFIKDRSSLASKGMFIHGGVIDAGYRGEIKVLMSCIGGSSWEIKAGDKIAQLVPVLPLTGLVTEVDDEEWEQIKTTDRGDKGFGSSGR